MERELLRADLEVHATNADLEVRATSLLFVQFQHS